MSGQPHICFVDIIQSTPIHSSTSSRRDCGATMWWPVEAGTHLIKMPNKRWDYFACHMPFFRHFHDTIRREPDILGKNVNIIRFCWKGIETSGRNFLPLHYKERGCFSPGCRLLRRHLQILLRVDFLTYFIANPPARGWQRNEGLLLLHSFLYVDILKAFSILRFSTSAKSVS